MMSMGLLLAITIGVAITMGLRAMSAYVNRRASFRSSLLIAIGTVAVLCAAWKTWLVALVVMSLLVALHPVVARDEPRPVQFAAEMIGGALALLGSIELLRQAVGIA
jgi:hypothetical protein